MRALFDQNAKRYAHSFTPSVLAFQELTLATIFFIMPEKWDCITKQAGILDNSRTPGA
jgi:hypothetical protein